MSRDPVPWQIGQHIAVIGKTGQGKTYLMSKLADMREYCVALRTKSDDIKFNEFLKVKDERRMNGLYDHRLLITPEYKNQVTVGARMMDRAWKHGGWTVFLDELFYITDRLKLESYVEMLLTQGRSKRVSVVAGMQRPVRVTRFAISEAAHVFAFRMETKDALFVSQATSEKVFDTIQRLKQFEFVHYHQPTNTIEVGNANELNRIIRDPREILKEVV